MIFEISLINAHKYKLTFGLDLIEVQAFQYCSSLLGFQVVKDDHARISIFFINFYFSKGDSNG